MPTWRAEVVHVPVPAPLKAGIEQTLAGLPLPVIFTVPVGVGPAPVTVAVREIAEDGLTVAVLGVAINPVVLGVGPAIG